MYNLGMIYYEDCDIQHNINKSIHYLTQAEYQNHSYAQFNLRFIYLNDISVHDIKKALNYFRNSADNKCLKSQLFLADLYFEGKILKFDIQDAVHLYKEISSFNNQCAKNNLGVIYKKGLKNTDTNILLAKEYFNEAINQKHDKLSMFNLAIKLSSKFFAESLIFMEIYGVDRQNNQAKTLGSFYQNIWKSCETKKFFFQK